MRFIEIMLYRFAEKCPQGKRGRPMSMSPEAAEQKGISVCEKQTKDGRTVAYKTGQQIVKEKESKTLSREARQKAGLKQRGRLSSANKEKLSAIVDELRKLKEKPKEEIISQERFENEILSLTKKIKLARESGNDELADNLVALRGKVFVLKNKHYNKENESIKDERIIDWGDKGIISNYQKQLEKKRPGLSKEANQFYAQLYYDWQHPRGQWLEHSVTAPILKKIAAKSDEQINKFVEENWHHLIYKYEPGAILDAMATIGVIKKYNLPHDYNVVFNDSIVKILSESGDIDSDLEEKSLKMINEYPWGGELVRLNSSEIKSMEKKRINEIKKKMDKKVTKDDA